MKTLLRFILIILLLNGCIQSDLSDCPNGDVRLDFKYTWNMANEDKLQDEVKNISMYVFDENNLFVKQVDYTVDNNQSVTFNLPEGLYNVLVVGNQDKNVSVPAITPSLNLSDFHISLNDLDGSFQDSLSLFFNTLVPQLTVEKLGTYREIDLYKKSKIVHLKLIYEEPAQSALTPDAFLTSANGSFNHQQEIVGTENIKYLPIFSSNNFVPGQSNIEADFRFSVFQMKEGVPLMLTASNIGTEEVFAVDIMDILSKTPIDLIREDVINIVMDFTHSLSIHVRVNEWELILNNGDIGIE
ncbi:MAG: FimB/Mfa2 family fimbrial subunit [Bacteroidales bacterium]